MDKESILIFTNILLIKVDVIEIIFYFDNFEERKFYFMLNSFFYILYTNDIIYVLWCNVRKIFINTDSRKCFVKKLASMMDRSIKISIDFHLREYRKEMFIEQKLIQLSRINTFILYYNFK